MKRWRNFHDGSGMLGNAVYHVSLFPLYRDSFLKCGIIIRVICHHKQRSGKKLGAGCSEQKYADL